MSDFEQKAVNFGKLKGKTTTLKNISQLHNTIEIENIAKMQVFGDAWYRVDNAGLIYPLNAYDQSNAMFAISALLKDNINSTLMQRAINLTVSHFPTIAGSIKNGLFWPYIDRPDKPITLRRQEGELCKSHTLYGNDSQIRITYSDNKLNVEFFHSATDGCGAVTFINSLLANYFLLSGITFGSYDNCYPYSLPIDTSIMKDKFSIVTTKDAPPLPRSIKSQKLAGTKAKNMYRVTRFVMNAKKLKNTAQTMHCTVTQLLSAIIFRSLQQHQQNNNAPQTQQKMRMLVPVDFRRIYNTQTVRNFSNYIFLQYNNQSTLAEIVTDMKQQMNNTLTKQYFSSMVNFNLKAGKNILMRMMPLSIKKIAIKLALTQLGEGNVNCATFSNIGVVQAPKEFSNLVDSYQFTLGRSNKDVIYFALITHNDKCTLTVTSSYQCAQTENSLLSQLKQLNIEVYKE